MDVAITNALEELQGMLEEMAANRGDNFDEILFTHDLCVNAVAGLIQFRTERDEFRKALKPFAQVWEMHTGADKDARYTSIYLRDTKHAATVLAKYPEEIKGE